MAEERKKKTNIKVLLVDDEALVREMIKKMLQNLTNVTTIGEAEGMQEALEIMRHQKVDVVISDIQMEHGSGFELASRMHEVYPQTFLVFLTGHASFALDGYEYGPVDFLVKPVNMERLSHTFDRIQERIDERNHRTKERNVGIQTEQGYEVFWTGDIAYIEKENRKLRIVRKDGSSVLTSESMQEFEEMFEDYGFFRCHQSYLIPLRDISEIQQDTFARSYHIRLKGCQTEIPLSRRKYSILKEVIQKENDSDE